MAVSKTFRAPSSGYIYGSRYMTLKIEEENINNEANTSDVKWTLTVSGDSTYYDTGVKITINGTNVYSKEVLWNGGFPAQQGSTSGYVRNIKHDDATGDKTIAVSFKAYVYYYSYQEYGGSVALSTIPRASKWTTEGSITSQTVVDSGISLSYTKYTDSFYQKATIEVLNPSTQTTSLLKTINNYASGASITFTSSELNTIYSTSAAQQTAVLYFKLYTYSDSGLTTQIGSYSQCIITFPLAIMAPTFSDFDYSDTNSTTTNLTKDSATIVKGYSTLNISIPTSKKATSNTRQTSMSHYIANGETIAYSSSAAVSKSFANYSNDNISVYAVDNRRTASTVVNKSFTTLNKYVTYSNVFKNDTQSYSRSDSGVGEFVTLQFSGTWWGNKKFGSANNAVTNSLSATYQYRISGTQNWSTAASITLTLGKAQQSDTYYTTFSYNGTVNGDLTSHGFNVGNSYDIIVIVSDALSSVTYNFSVHSGEPAIALYKNKASLGAKYDETLGGTQLWGDVYLNGDIINIINPIMESGSNANGNYIKYYDGTMICYKTVTATVAMTTAWGSLYEGTMNLGNWAASFISVPHVQITNASATGAMIESYEIQPTTSGAGQIFLARGNSFTSNVTINVFAIGRWK